ncbi:hypothetical protein, partial [Hafnia alvei]|uniref:hypothetical protein n=1 Tax=Hafnia alvei TaxID=569 RepID=UPI0005BB04CB
QQGCWWQVEGAQDVRSETGRPNGSVKSARVESPGATGLSSDAYANGFIEMQMLTGVRNLTYICNIEIVLYELQYRHTRRSKPYTT